MENNMMLETTIKTFEGGIGEIKRLKKSLDSLSDSIINLVDFKDTFNLEDNAKKVEEIRSGINSAIEEEKNLIGQYRDSITKLKRSHKNEINKLTKGMDEFLAEAQGISDKLKSMSNDFDINKIEEISRGAGELLGKIEEKYNGLGLEYEKIVELGEGIEGLRKTVDEVNEKVRNEDIGERVEKTKAVITEFELNYHRLNEEYGKLNQEIYSRGNRNIEELTNSIKGFYNIVEGFHDKLLSLGKDIEAEKLEERYRATGEIIRRIYEDIESDYIGVRSEYEKVQEIPLSLNNLRESIAGLQNKLREDNLQESTEVVLRTLEDFREETHVKSMKYFDLSKSAYEGSINSIKEMQEAVEKLKEQASSFQENLLRLYNNISTDDFLAAARKASEQLEVLNGQYSRVAATFEGLINIDVHNESIMEEVKNNGKVAKSIEDRMSFLEEKLIFLIDENQSLKKLYSEGIHLEARRENMFNGEALRDISQQEWENFPNEKLSNKHELAVKHLKRYSEKEDLKKAIELFTVSSEEGNNDSSFELAEIYYYGRGVEQNLKLALEYYLKGANNGHHKSSEMVVQIYEKRAGAGDVEYQRLLGDMYLQGKMVKADVQRGLKWYESAAAKGDSKTSALLVKLYESLANKNDANAQFRLGEIYYKGQWVTKDNYKAFQWYKAAENQGNFDAGNKAGEVAFHIAEEIANTNASQAIKWYETGAKQGNAEAQYKLGEIYHKGKIIPKNEEEALKYYQMAANQGHLLAIAQIKIIKPFARFFK